MKEEYEERVISLQHPLPFIIEKICTKITSILPQIIASEIKNAMGLLCLNMMLLSMYMLPIILAGVIYDAYRSKQYKLIIIASIFLFISIFKRYYLLPLWCILAVVFSIIPLPYGIFFFIQDIYEDIYEIYEDIYESPKFYMWLVVSFIMICRLIVFISLIDPSKPLVDEEKLKQCSTSQNKQTPFQKDTVLKSPQ